MTKHAPYWHPRYPTPDGRTYCAIDRADAAGLLRQHRETRSVYRIISTHGQRVYILHTPGMHYDSGCIFMCKRSAA